MTKIAGIVIILAISLIFFSGPIREAVNNLVPQKTTKQADEEQVIGTTAIYNPRVKDVQITLKSIGLFPDEVDGRMGVQTRAAIMEFQKKEKLKPNGKVDSATWTALIKVNEAPKTAAGSLVKGQQPLPPPLADSSEKSPSPVAVDVTKLSIQTAAVVTQPIKPTKKTFEQPKSILSSHLKLKDSVKRIQLALKESGFYHGAIDGKAGEQTRKAILAFQKSKGLTPDGLVGVKTWQELSKYLPDS